MVVLVPKLHDLVGNVDSRTASQLRAMNVELAERQVTVRVFLPDPRDGGRLLLAETLIDMVLRLDPLVGEVQIDAPGLDLDSVVADLARRLPLEVGGQPSPPHYTVAIGGGVAGASLVVDGAGWLAAIGTTIDGRDDGNPVGPLSAATFAAAEVFKAGFGLLYPDRAREMDLQPWNGVFSLFSYGRDDLSPTLDVVDLDATLVGLGGVGAGFIRGIASLGDRVHGSLALVDDDTLTTHNLNRVSYASVEAAVSGALKVDEAVALLLARCPNLTVTPYPERFDLYKRRTPRRADRRYDVVVTGLDNDDTRWEVQRDLPRILIDGATGRDMNIRIERVEFGRYGCLGCTRRAPAPPAGAPRECDAPPDVRAPSLSFLSSFPGILAAGEVIKESMGTGQLRGGFDHVFRYGPNPDMLATPAMRDDCTAGCGSAAKLRDYRAKYPSEVLPG